MKGWKTEGFTTSWWDIAVHHEDFNNLRWRWPPCYTLVQPICMKWCGKIVHSAYDNADLSFLSLLRQKPLPRDNAAIIGTTPRADSVHETCENIRLRIDQLLSCEIIRKLIILTVALTLSVGRYENATSEEKGMATYRKETTSPSPGKPPEGKLGQSPWLMSESAKRP